MTFDFEYFRQHVLPRAGNVRCGRPGVEPRFGAQRRLVHDQAIESNEKIRPATTRLDITDDIVACDDMIVSQLRKRSSTTHFDDNER